MYSIYSSIVIVCWKKDWELRTASEKCYHHRCFFMHMGCAEAYAQESQDFLQYGCVHRSGHKNLGMWEKNRKKGREKEEGIWVKMKESS